MIRQSNQWSGRSAGTASDGLAPGCHLKGFATGADGTAPAGLHKGRWRALSPVDAASESGRFSRWWEGELSDLHGTKESPFTPA